MAIPHLRLDRPRHFLYSKLSLLSFEVYNRLIRIPIYFLELGIMSLTQKV